MSSLLSLEILECPNLEERCNGRVSQYWHLCSRTYIPLSTHRILLWKKLILYQGYANQQHTSKLLDIILDFRRYINYNDLVHLHALKHPEISSSLEKMSHMLKNANSTIERTPNELLRILQID